MTSFPEPPEASAEPSPDAAMPVPAAPARDLPLAPAWIKMRRLAGLIRAAVFSAAAGGVMTVGLVIGDGLSFPVALTIWLVLTLLLALPPLFWPPVAYRHSSYRRDREGLHLRRGVLWRSQIAVPSSRIQHTDVSQGPFERMYGLATLTVHTAGNHYAAVSLPGLEYEQAVALRDDLLAARAAEAGDAV